MAKKKPDPRITKRRVTMTNVLAGPPDADGRPQIITHTAVDYVPAEHVEAYAADARTRWQSVEVSDQPDAGPGGYDGPTTIPAHLKEK